MPSAVRAVGVGLGLSCDPKADCGHVKALSLTVINLLCYAFMPLLVGFPVNILPPHTNSCNSFWEKAIILLFSLSVRVPPYQ
jgi:hypothetical protein